MARLKTLHRCSACGYSAPKPLGQCPGCSSWNSMVEEVVESRPAGRGGWVSPVREGRERPEAALLSEVGAEPSPRTATGLGELDRLLGGGLVAGQVVLLGGPPGIGKSTLMLQAAVGLAEGSPVLYVSGEESSAQISGRARRLGVCDPAIYLLCEDDLSRILEATARIKPSAIILDSVQTVFRPDLDAGPGSVLQVRECTSELVRLAKAQGIMVFLLGHVTKEGLLAGPKILEHMVDTVLYFDMERQDSLRMLRAQKNRFGPTDEVGIFQMSARGLQELEDAASYFIEGAGVPKPGRSFSVSLEGTRPLLAEVQALAAPTRYPLPRRMATGLETNRVIVLLAALEQNLRLRLEDRDVYVALAGGLKVSDPALDLAVAMAVASSMRGKALPADSIWLGEVGLLGEIGRVGNIEARLPVAAKAGFARAFIPARCARGVTAPGGLRVIVIEDLAGAVRLALGRGD